MCLLSVLAKRQTLVALQGQIEGAEQRAERHWVWDGQAQLQLLLGEQPLLPALLLPAVRWVHVRQVMETSFKALRVNLRFA